MNFQGLYIALEAEDGEFCGGVVDAFLGILEALDEGLEGNGAFRAADDVFSAALGAGESVEIFGDLVLTGANWAGDGDEVGHVLAPRDT